MSVMQMLLGGKSPAEAMADFFPPETQAQLKALCIAIAETRASVARIEVLAMAEASARRELSEKLDRITEYVLREVALAGCGGNRLLTGNGADAS